MPEQKVRGELNWVEVSRLLFDDHNFRFSEDSRGESQEELLKILIRDVDPFTIAKSLADNGYFIEEPLVVIPKPSSDNYIVVEGNRRLAALKLLLNGHLRSLTTNPGDWKELADSLKEDISEVPVVEYQNREELTSFLGYRHIAGILKWDPLAKARFVSNLVESKGKEADFAEIARETGSIRRTIRDNYIAYRILLQASDTFDIDTSKLEKNFSVFYRALGNLSIADFIGLNKDRLPAELQTPISKKKATALKELVSYIHGTKDEVAVLTDSRQLTKLGDVLSNKPAYEYLKAHRKLDQAHQLTGGEERRLIDNLNQASFYLDESLRDAHRHKGSKKVALCMKRCAATMVEILKHFPEIQRELEDKH